MTASPNQRAVSTAPLGGSAPIDPGAVNVNLEMHEYSHSTPPSLPENPQIAAPPVQLLRRDGPRFEAGGWSTLSCPQLRVPFQAPNLSTARARALAASSSRFFGGALVSSDRSRRFEMAATSSMAA